MSLFNIFLVLLVKTECMMVSKMGATWMLLHVLLNIITSCLVTWSVTAHVSEPIPDCSCIDIGPLMHPYRPDRVAASRWRSVRWNHKPFFNTLTSFYRLYYGTPEMKDGNKFSASLWWKTGKKKNSYRSNLAIQKEETFIFNSASVDVTSTLYPSYLIAFFS